MKGFKAAAWHWCIKAGEMHTLCVQRGDKDLCRVFTKLLLHFSAD